MLRALIQKFLQLVRVKQNYQSVLYAILKNQTLLKNKKQKDY